MPFVSGVGDKLVYASIRVASLPYSYPPPTRGVGGEGRYRIAPTPKERVGYCIKVSIA